MTSTWPATSGPGRSGRDPGPQPHLAVAHLDAVRAGGTRRGQAGHGTGGEVEPALVRRALHRPILDPPFGQRRLLVGAGVVQGVEVPRVAEHRDGVVPPGGLGRDRERGTVAEVSDRADPNAVVRHGEASFSFPRRTIRATISTRATAQTEPSAMPRPWA